MSELMMLGILVAVAIGLVIYSLLPNRGEQAESVRRRAMGLSGDDDTASAKERARKNAGNKSMLEMAAPILSRPMMPKTEQEQSSLRAKLASAGYRRESIVMMFLASKIIVGGAMGITAFLYSSALGAESPQVIYYGVFGLGLGFMGPNLWLGNAVKKRGEAIRNGMPDSLDLMVVAVESGLGLDAALLRVSDEMKHVHGALAEELQIATIETQMGTSRSEALQRMAERTGVQEMRALVAVITQAEKLGTSIAKALRNQAESLRTKRRQKAEERAQKTAVKLLIPLILFIFPAIFVVLAGPAAIHIMHTFQSGALKK
ncbi:Bacterial type II secretion system protein F domain protein [Phycisphaerae bacterium RAS2]|nr:Bacterial type II secretion system protein F domain protein [Phycisphaerae bacterium RAS2]